MKRYFFLSLLYVSLPLLFLLPGNSFAQKDTVNSKLSFDIGLTRERKNINLWPVLKILKNPEVKDYQVLFPVFRSYHNYRDFHKTSYLFPFYWYDSNAGIRDWRFLSFYYPSILHFSREKKENFFSFKLLEIAPHVNAFEFTKSNDGSVVQNNLLFFLWYKNNEALHQSYFVVFPLSWYFQNPQRKSYTLFPVFSKGTYNENKEKYFAATPFFWHFKFVDGYSNLLFPICWNERRMVGKKTIDYRLVIFPIVWDFKNREKSTLTIFPLYFSTVNSQYQTGLKIISPLVWNIKNQRTRTFLILPVFIKKTANDSSQKSFYILPLAGHTWTEDKCRTFIFPLWWYSKKKYYNGTTLKDVLFPVFWWKRETGVNNLVVFPVFWKYDNPSYKSMTIMPFYSKGQSADGKKKHFAVTPFYWNIKVDNEKMFKQSKNLYPVWFYSKLIFKKDKSPDQNHAHMRYNSMEGDTLISNVIFPVYWHFSSIKTNNNVIFPVYWKLKNKNYQSLTLIPLFSYGHSNDMDKKHYSIAGLYWHFSSSFNTLNFLVPVWWHNVTRKSSSNVIFPVYWSYKYFSDHSTGRVIFPVYWNLKNDKRQSIALFPIIYYKKITPLYNRYNERFLDHSTGNSFVVFPVFWHLKLYSKNDTLISNKLFPVFVSYKDHSSKELGVLLFFWNFKDKDRHFNAVLPFWIHNKKFTVTENKMSADTSDFKAILPVYYSYQSNQRNNRVIFPFIWNFKNTGYASRTMIPFISVGHSNDYTKKHLVLTPLYWHFKDHDWFSNTLFPLFWDRGDSKKRLTVFFPVAWNVKTKNFVSTTVIPFYYAGYSTDHTKKYKAITPLFWNVRKDSGSYTTFIPLFEYKVSGQKKIDFDILYFVLRYSQQANLSSFHLLWPICEYSKGNDLSYFRIAPVVWYKKSPIESYFSIQPFYYIYKNNDRQVQRFFWELVTLKNFYHGKKSFSILWRTAFWDSYADHDFETRILYLLYANVKKEGNREKSYFPFYYSSRQTNGDKYVSTFFYFFTSIKKNIKNTDQFYKEVRIFWFIRVLSNYNSLKEKGGKQRKIEN